MVVCKYYRRGYCRFGQLCQFEHGSNNFGNFSEDEIIATVVNRVQIAENGGQWLLSCFAPFKDHPCVPGMEDLSPEEARWEMYEAQKNGVVEQAKLRFQQLCRDMKAKQDALKSPSPETRAMLKKLFGTEQKGLSNPGATSKSSTFSFAAPQLSLSNTSTSNVFTSNKPFASQSNPFGGNFTSSNNASLFGKTNNNSTVFGGTPSFSNSLNFSTTQKSSIFGAQNPQNFSAMPSQGSFLQQNNFGNANQMGNIFSRPQETQINSVFSNSSNNVLGNTLNSQGNPPSLFGGSKNNTTVFGGTSSSGIFGGNTATSNSNNSTSNTLDLNIFKKKSVFSAAPGFTNFSNNNSSIFNQTVFNNPPATGNIFAGANASQTFTNNQGNFPANSNFFSNSQNSEPAIIPEISPTNFGVSAIKPDEKVNESDDKKLFATSGNTFAMSQAASAFSFDKKNLLNTAANTGGSNPFAVKVPQNSPFASTNTAQSFGNSGSSFTKSAFGSSFANAVIDDSIYSTKEELSEEEINAYLADGFVLGKIPLKPPTKDMR